MSAARVCRPASSPPTYTLLQAPNTPNRLLRRLLVTFGSVRAHAHAHMHCRTHAHVHEYTAVWVSLNVQALHTKRPRTCWTFAHPPSKCPASVSCMQDQAALAIGDTAPRLRVNLASAPKFGCGAERNGLRPDLRNASLHNVHCMWGTVSCAQGTALLQPIPMGRFRGAVLALPMPNQIPLGGCQHRFQHTSSEPAPGQDLGIARCLNSSVV